MYQLFISSQAFLPQNASRHPPQRRIRFIPTSWTRLLIICFSRDHYPYTYYSMLRHAVVRFPAAFKRINVIRGGCVAQCSPCRSLEIHRHSHARVMTSAAAALSSSFQDKRDTGNTRAVVLLALSLIAGVGGIRTASPTQTEAGAMDAGVKEIEYTKADVQAHKTIETGVWVTYKDGVYDITKFAENHPGKPDALSIRGSDSDRAFLTLPRDNIASCLRTPRQQEETRFSWQPGARLNPIGICMPSTKILRCVRLTVPGPPRPLFLPSPGGSDCLFFFDCISEPFC